MDLKPKSSRIKVKVKNIPIDSIKINTLYILSDPVTPELYLKHRKRYPGTPSLIVNGNNELISGYDHFVFMKENRIDHQGILRSDLDKKDSLFVGYNLRRDLKEFNLFEKISFVNKVIDFSKVSEIFDRTGIDLPINDKLIENMDMLMSEEFGKTLKENMITIKTALKVCEMDPDDRREMINLFSLIRMSSSRQKKFIDLFEDILFRDKCRIKDLLKRMEFFRLKEDPRGIELIFEMLFKIRYPEYSKYEAEWKREIDKMEIPSDWKISHSTFFEKAGVELKIVKKNIKEIEEIIGKIKKG